jgi:hypothetical protein
MNKTRKRYRDMSLRELREATKEFDVPNLNPRSKPVPAKVKAKHDRVLSRLGRPRVGGGARRVLISIERGLLKEADKLAKSRAISRSQLIAIALRNAIRRSA